MKLGVVLMGAVLVAGCSSLPMQQVQVQPLQVCDTARMQRIEQLTPLSLADPDDRLIAHVAVKIIESQRAGDRLPSGPGTRPGTPGASQAAASAESAWKS